MVQRSVVQSMSEGMAEVKRCANTVLTAGQAIKRIQELVDQDAKDTQAAAQEQNAAVEEIADQLQKAWIRRLTNSTVKHNVQLC